MDAQALFSEFLSSDHGVGAMQALTAQGVSETDAQTMLGHAADAAQAHVAEQSGGGLLGDHAGKSFLASMAAGLMRGDGVTKSLEDGGEGMVSGRVAEALASRAGVDSGLASTLAAAATPFLMSFLKEKLA